MLKICTKCKTGYAATTEYFIPDKRNRSGMGGQCKKCKSVYDKQHSAIPEIRLAKYNSAKKYRASKKGVITRWKYYQGHKEEITERNRVYHEIHPDISRRASRTYTRNNPRKKKAHQLLNDAVRTGKIIKPGRCCRCKKRRKVEAHHEDYSKPYDVEWLCRECHCLEHSSFF